MFKVSLVSFNVATSCSVYFIVMFLVYNSDFFYFVQIQLPCDQCYFAMSLLEFVSRMPVSLVQIALSDSDSSIVESVVKLMRGSLATTQQHWPRSI